jgi:hypothetical protein
VTCELLCFGLDKLHAIRHSREGEVASGGGGARLFCYLNGRSELCGIRKRIECLNRMTSLA